MDADFLRHGVLNSEIASENVGSAAGAARPSAAPPSLFAARLKAASRRWGRLVGESPAAVTLEATLQRAARVESTVLITGETGCGKEEIARAVHAQGPRSGGPFVAINCGAMAASLIESQLFGHEKGSFTGAVGPTRGVFRTAEGGIVFLDEIGEMPLDLQPRLLRVLQQREVTPVGSAESFPVDVQVIAATNRDLTADIRAGRFREDLFYRLNTIELAVPPLRDRPTDIPLFVDHFRLFFAEKFGVTPWQPDAATLARCYVEADRDDVRADAERLVAEFNRLPGRPGWFTETYCVCSRFFQPANGGRIDAIRDAIAAKGLPPDLEAVMLVALMEAADRVDLTTGVQMAYLKQWAPRAHNDLELRMPDVLPRARGGRCVAICGEALAAARQTRVDVAYVDPPYNQHSYLGNYHIWESLVRWDKPEVYGVACKRVDVRERQSVFNSRPRFRSAMKELLEAIQAPVMVVSFSNEGYLKRDEMEELLRGLYDGAAFLETIETDYKRYVGAQIGIYNPQGEKVGKVSHLRNKEYLYVVANRPIAEALNGLLLAEPSLFETAK